MTPALRAKSGPAGAGIWATVGGPEGALAEEEVGNGASVGAMVSDIVVVGGGAGKGERHDALDDVNKKKQYKLG